MLKYQSQNQLSLFATPFEQQLDKNNRWVLLANKLPWDDLVKVYHNRLNAHQGAPAINGRMVIASLIIKYRMNFSDRETIEAIKENMYMQYFVGLSSFTTEAIFDPSELVHIRKRLQVADFNAMTEELMREAGLLPCEEEKQDDGDNSCQQTKTGTPTTEVPGEEPATPQDSAEQPEAVNEGVMQLDATVSDQKIKYPNDVDLLNTGREETDRLIDILNKPNKALRPRTYRVKARKEYLNFARKQNKTKREIKKGRKQQLQYLKRNLKHLDHLIACTQKRTATLQLPFTHRDVRMLCATRIVYEQQLHMHNTNSNRIDDRIVSIYQPYVRPIMRGKSKNKVEFGNKNGISLQNGYAWLEKLSWDAYNECNDLQPAAANYKRMHGHYPEWIIADSIYHTKANKNYCRDNHIKLIGKTLSRHAKAKMSAEERKSYQKMHNSRNHIEGKFGQGKNGYELNEIKARYANTSESWIASVYFVMNILVFAGSSLLSFLCAVYCHMEKHIAQNMKRNLIHQERMVNTLRFAQAV